MTPDLSKELAQIVTFAGQVFVHIRFAGWHAKDEGGSAGVERMTTWADVAHNLVELGQLTDMYLGGDQARADAVLHTCKHLVSVMTRQAEREASWGAAENPIDYTNGIAALNALATKIRDIEAP